MVPLQRHPDQEPAGKERGWLERTEGHLGQHEAIKVFPEGAQPPSASEAHTKE